MMSPIPAVGSSPGSVDFSPVGRAFVDPGGTPNWPQGDSRWSIQWHHLLPREVFENPAYGLSNIVNHHAQEYGWMLYQGNHSGEGGVHYPQNANGQIIAKWNQDWEKWVNEMRTKKQPITKQAIDAKLKDMMYGDKSPYKKFFANPTSHEHGATRSYQENRAHLLEKPIEKKQRDIENLEKQRDQLSDRAVKARQKLEGDIKQLKVDKSNLESQRKGWLQQHKKFAKKKYFPQGKSVAGKTSGKGAQSAAQVKPPAQGKAPIPAAGNGKGLIKKGGRGVSLVIAGAMVYGWLFPSQAQAQEPSQDNPLPGSGGTGEFPLNQLPGSGGSGEFPQSGPAAGAAPPGEPAAVGGVLLLDWFWSKVGLVNDISTLTAAFGSSLSGIASRFPALTNLGRKFSTRFAGLLNAGSKASRFLGWLGKGATYAEAAKGFGEFLGEAYKGNLYRPGGYADRQADDNNSWMDGTKWKEDPFGQAGTILKQFFNPVGQLIGAGRNFGRAYDGWKNEAIPAMQQAAESYRDYGDLSNRTYGDMKGRLDALQARIDRGETLSPEDQESYQWHKKELGNLTPEQFATKNMSAAQTLDHNVANLPVASVSQIAQGEAINPVTGNKISIRNLFGFFK